MYKREQIAEIIKMIEIAIKRNLPLDVVAEDIEALFASPAELTDVLDKFIKKQNCGYLQDDMDVAIYQIQSIYEAKIAEAVQTEKERIANEVINKMTAARPGYQLAWVERYIKSLIGEA